MSATEPTAAEHAAVEPAAGTPAAAVAEAATAKPVGPAVAEAATAKPVGPAPEKETYPEPAERPTHYFVASDSHGFVGAFYSAADVEAVVGKYHLVPFLVQKFAVAPGPVATVWVVLYRDLDAVAFVSNSRVEAERIQGVYGKVGLTYVDSIDYWEHPANRVAKAASDRLESLSRAHTMYAGPASLEELQARELEDYERLTRLVAPKPDGPLARVLQENERITILDCVVPVDVGGGAIATREEAAAEAGGAVATREEAAAATREEAAAEAGGAVATREEAAAEAGGAVATREEVAAEAGGAVATREEAAAEAGGAIATREEAPIIAAPDGQ